MPPIYSWHCDKCEKKAEILRSFDEHDSPPNTEEVPGDCVPTGDVVNGIQATAPHKWTKKIHAPLITKGAGWGGGKGHW